MLLAIDTATRLLSLALHDGDTLLAEATISVERNHSALLAPLIKQTLAQCGVAQDELTALAVCIGPGSYTGLRIGVALAMGMASVSNLPLIPASALDIIAAAQDQPLHAEKLIVTVPAGRQRVIWADYRHDGVGWLAQGEARLGGWDDLFQTQMGSYALSGELTAAGLQRVRAAIASGQQIHLIAAAQRLRRAGYLAEIAWQRLREDGADAFPADRVRPIYLRSPG